MKRQSSRARTIASLWELARSGDFRGGAAVARDALGALRPNGAPGRRVELHLISAFCSMRQGHHSEALRELETADHAAASFPADSRIALRVETWRAELAYFQGRYSESSAIIDRLLARLERKGDWAYVAFAQRIHIAILLAHADYEGAVALGRSGDPGCGSERRRLCHRPDSQCPRRGLLRPRHVKLSGPHARAHLSSLDPRDAVPMEADAREALHLFQRARAVAESAHYEFAAWYVAGNIERLEILLGHADRAIRPMRKRLGVLQARGATYDEMVMRSNLAWGLRTLGRYREPCTSSMSPSSLPAIRVPSMSCSNSWSTIARSFSMPWATRRLLARAIGVICNWWARGTAVRRARQITSIRRHPSAHSIPSSSSARIGSFWSMSANRSRYRTWQGTVG